MTIKHNPPTATNSDTPVSEPMEATRRAMCEVINAEPGSREYLETEHGQVWDTTELQQDFTVQGFAAPFVIVTHKATGQHGALMFQHRPRFYFCFQAT